MKPKFLNDKRKYVSGRIRRFASLYARMLLNNKLNYQTLMNVYNRYEKRSEWKVSTNLSQLEENYNKAIAERNRFVYLIQMKILRV